MGFEIRIIDPLSIEEWDASILKFKEASFFHSSQWARLLSDSYGFKPLYCSAFENGKLAAAVPLMETRDLRGRKNGVSLPFSDFCGPLVDNKEIFSSLFDQLSVLAKKRQWRYIELRGGQQYLADETVFDTVYTHEIDLNRGSQEIFKSFADTNRRNIRKAEKSNLTVTHENSLDAMRKFYRLNCLTRREHGLPPQPWSFFNTMPETIFAQGKGFVTLAAHQGRPVAGNVYLTFGTLALYKYGASDRRFQQFRPANLVMWEGIKKCREQGFHTLHLGRTEMHHAGLLQYKRGFNGTERTINYYRFDVLAGSFLRGHASNAGRLRSQVLSRLPIPLLRIIGDLFYKFVG